MTVRVSPWIRNLLILFVIGSLIGVAISRLMARSVQAGDQFLAALRDEDLVAARALLAADLTEGDLTSLRESLEFEGGSFWSRTGIGWSIAELVRSRNGSGPEFSGWRLLLRRERLDWRIYEVLPLDVATAERLVPNPRRLLAMIRSRFTSLLTALEAGDGIAFEAQWDPEVIVRPGPGSLLGRYPNTVGLEPPLSSLLASQPLQLSKPQVDAAGNLRVRATVGNPATHSALLTFRWRTLRWQLIGFEVQELETS
ncbi:MAG: hypothetical protein AAGE01_14455 [Pseudomonadota bacterium]